MVQGPRPGCPEQTVQKQESCTSRCASKPSSEAVARKDSVCAGSGPVSYQNATDWSGPATALSLAWLRSCPACTREEGAFALVFGRSWPWPGAEARKLLGRVREVQMDRATVQLYWESSESQRASPQGPAAPAMELSPLQGFIDLKAIPAAKRQLLLTGRDVGVQVSPLAVHTPADGLLPLMLADSGPGRGQQPVRPARPRKPQPQPGWLAKNQRSSSTYWGNARSLPFCLAGHLARHLRGSVRELRTRSAVVQIFWETSPVPGQEPQLGPVIGTIRMQDLLAAYGKTHPRRQPRCEDFLCEGQLVCVNVIGATSTANEPALALALSTYQPALSWSPPPPCAGRAPPVEWRRFLDKHGLVVESANLKQSPAEAIEVFRRELGSQRTPATETLAATIWELTQTGQDMVVSGAFPTEERLILQSLLALRHVAALPRSPSRQPDVLILCSKSFSERFRSTCRQGSSSDGQPCKRVLRQTLSGTTSEILRKARLNPELLSRVSLVIVDMLPAAKRTLEQLEKVLAFMPNGRRWGPSYVFHRETLPANGTVAETALVDAPARLQFANGLCGAHIRMQMVSDDSAKEAAALISQVHARQSILVFTHEESALLDELRRVVSAHALKSERLRIRNSATPWRLEQSQSFDIVLHVSPPPSAREYLRRLASCSKEAISLVTRSGSAGTVHQSWAKHVLDFATDAELAKLQRLAPLDRPRGQGENVENVESEQLEADKGVDPVELSHSFQKDYSLHAGEDVELVWRAGAETDLFEGRFACLAAAVSDHALTVEGPAPSAGSELRSLPAPLLQLRLNFRGAFGPSQPRKLSRFKTTEPYFEAFIFQDLLFFPPKLAVRMELRRNIGNDGEAFPATEPRRGRWQKASALQPKEGNTDSAEEARTAVDDSDDEGFWGTLPPREEVPKIAEAEPKEPAKPAHARWQLEQPAYRQADQRQDRLRGRLSQKQRKQQSWENQASSAVPNVKKSQGYTEPDAIDPPVPSRAPEAPRQPPHEALREALEVELDPSADDERSVLEAIYGNEFESLSANEWRVVLPGTAGAPSAAVRFLLPAGYPRSGEPPVPLFDCEGASQGLRHAATEALAELVENWEPPTEGEGCIYQWVERIRECLEPALAAEVFQRDEMDTAIAKSLAAAEEATVQAAASKSFTFLPANPQYGQRRRVFDASSFDDANAVEILRGESFVDRKSTFQGFAAKVSNQGQVNWVLRTLLEDRKIAVATHNMFAYRFRDDARNIQVADNEDDGEDGAGSKLAELLNLAGCEEVFVMVSRWYGGIQLGPDRFKHIARAASVLLDEAGWSSRGRGASGAGQRKKK
ncbi:impact-A [Symbiodinium natans]|uniref:Impact-A protein n=1 Tax=Symbiodinium natans TaxID=878477 RepID=A0A812STS1_9DINO|nr:impact-A [Symbiodinium natans]